MKKGIKITLIVIAVIIALFVIDTLQAKFFDNSPLLKIRDNIDGGPINYVDKGLLVNHYMCNSKEEATIWKWGEFFCSVPEEEPVKTETEKPDERTCMNNYLGASVVTEYSSVAQEELADLIDYDEEKVEYSYVGRGKRLDKDGETGVYAVIKTEDKTIINNLDKYFSKNYKGYGSFTINGYTIFNSNGQYVDSLKETLNNQCFEN